MRHLVYVLNQYWANEASHFAHVGGLLEAIAQRGVRVTLVIEKGDATPEFGTPGITVLCVPRSRPPWRHVHLVRIIRRVIGRESAAVFVRIAVPAALSAVVGSIGRQARVFYWQSGTVHEADRAAHQGLGRLRWLLTTWLPFRLLVSTCHRFVTGPEAMLDYYRDIVGVPSRKLLNLYNDIDLTKFRSAMTACDRNSTRARLGATPRDTVLLFVHRLSPVRRTLEYLPGIFEALAASPDSRPILVFAGGGPELDGLRLVVRRSGLEDRCRVLGVVPHRELAVLYSAADIFLNPSFAEGFPRVILEGMAAGLPIVSTDAGGTRQLVGPIQAQFIVAATKPAAFGVALASILVDQEARFAAAQENRETVRKFDTQVVASMYERALFE